MAYWRSQCVDLILTFCSFKIHFCVGPNIPKQLSEILSVAVVFPVQFIGCHDLVRAMGRGTISFSRRLLSRARA